MLIGIELDLGDEDMEEVSAIVDAFDRILGLLPHNYAIHIQG